MNGYFGRCGREFITLAEPTACWGGDFPADLKFYWLHFEVKAPDNIRAGSLILACRNKLRLPIRSAGGLVSPVLKRTGKASTHSALEFIVLLILQQLTRDARLDNRPMVQAPPLPGKRRN